MLPRGAARTPIPPLSFLVSWTTLVPPILNLSNILESARAFRMTDGVNSRIGDPLQTRWCWILTRGGYLKTTVRSSRVTAKAQIRKSTARGPFPRSETNFCSLFPRCRFHGSRGCLLAQPPPRVGERHFFSVPESAQRRRALRNGFAQVYWRFCQLSNLTTLALHGNTY